VHHLAVGLDDITCQDKHRKQETVALSLYILFARQSGCLFLCAISINSDIEQGSYHESENSPQGAKGAPSQIAAYPLT
jgi:hypothetical protein